MACFPSHLECLCLHGFIFAHRKRNCHCYCYPAKLQLQRKPKSSEFTKVVISTPPCKNKCLGFLQACLEKKAIWIPWPWLKSLPMVVKSSQPKETKWEKCKCKCWEGPSGQGKANPFDDFTQEIGSGNVREQATCEQKNQKVRYQNWITVTLKSLRFVPKYIRAARTNVGLETLPCHHSLVESSWGEKKTKRTTAWRPQNILESQGWVPSKHLTIAGPLTLDRTRMRNRRSRFCFIILSNVSRPPLTFSLFPWTPTMLVSIFTLTVTCGKTTHYVKIVIKTLNWCEK